MRARAAVVLIQDDKIALIERHKSGKHYFVFPGGKIKPGETAQVAAAREANEELGLEVKIARLLAEVWYQGTPQYYFLADPIGGQFGHGIGSELASLPDSKKGSYLPIWMGIADIPTKYVLPKIMADYIWQSTQTGWADAPLVVTDRPPDQV